MDNRKLQPEDEGSGLTHLSPGGEVRMVDVTAKEATAREARARAVVRMERQTLELMLSAGLKKGDVFSVARIAGIMGAKRTPDLIPLCHPIALTGVEVELEAEAENPSLIITVTARTTDRTGVEMEAMVGAALAALAVYDMGKSVDRSMHISEIALLEKKGGRSGHFTREGGPPGDQSSPQPGPCDPGQTPGKEGGA
jgi:cyclic pyranopterin phosphate synthase